MHTKFLKIFIPTLASFIVLVISIWLVDKYSTHNPESSPQIDIPLLAILLVLFLIAQLFQAFCILPFWYKIKMQKKVSGLRLWQIVGLTSLLFGNIIILKNAFVYRLNQTDILEALTFAVLFTIYWVTNFLVLSIIDKS